MKQDTFTTFRFMRRDRDWEIREFTQVVLEPRSPKRQYLGIVQIINKEPRISSLWPPARRIFTSPLPALITEEEAIADGFASLAEMEAWLIKAHGRERVENEIINKLTLRWDIKVNWR